MKTIKYVLTSLFTFSVFCIVLSFPYNANCGLFGSSVTEYAPFKEGREWKYSYLEKINDNIVSRRENHYSALSPTTLFGKDVIPVKMLRTDTNDYEIYYLFVDSNSLILVGKQGATDTEPKEVNALILKTPLKINATWESAGWTHTVLSLDESVTVPAGTFKNCLKIRSTGNTKGKNVEKLAWHTPDIGDIKTIVYINKDNPSESFQKIIQLISFKK